MKTTEWVSAFVVAASLVALSSYARGDYGCLDCHIEPPPAPPVRNCLASGCHDTYDNRNHHTTGLSLAGRCTPCHTSVADYSEENPLSYPATDVTPAVGSCANCHKGHANPLDEDGNPYPHPIYETAELEHMDLQGHVYNCLLCHGDPGNWEPDNPYLPFHHDRDFVVYTGTHDNDTTLGWYRSLEPNARAYVDDFLGHPTEAMPWPLTSNGTEIMPL